MSLAQAGTISDFDSKSSYLVKIPLLTLLTGFDSLHLESPIDCPRQQPCLYLWLI